MRPPGADGVVAAAGADRDMPNRLARRPSRWLLAVIGLAIASRIFSLVVVAVASSGGTTVWPLLTRDHGPLVAWDGQWYLAIAQNGYHAQPLQSAHHDFAFFPAWPILIRVGTLGFITPGVAAVALANILFVAGLVLAARVMAGTVGEAAALRGVTLLAFSPPAFVYSLAYSEALFLASSAGFFLVATGARRRSLLLGATMLTRITGGALVIATIVAAARRRSTELWRADVIAVVAGLAAFAGWWAYIANLTGDPLGFLHGALGWQSSSGPLALLRAIRAAEVRGFVEYGFAALILGAALALARRDPPQAAFALVAVAIGLAFGRDSSVARYAVAAFPAFGLLGEWGGRRGSALILLVFLAGQAFLAASAFGFGSASQPP